MKYLKANSVKADAMIDGLIVALWKQGLDTERIGKRLHMPECQVANDLPRILEQSRR